MYLVTGANGFIGGAVTRALSGASIPVVAAIRSSSRADANQSQVRRLDGVVSRVVTTIDGRTDWSPILEGVGTVIHCAAKAHMVRIDGHIEAKEVREVNVAGTLRLAEQAASAGVKRFVFLSSIGVNGRNSLRPFNEEHDPNPHDVYSRSKLEAEQGLFSLFRERGLEVVVIRPPLVYGAGAPGRFGTLVRWATSGLPLPLGGVNNCRSLLALDNLVDVILLCADRGRSPQAACQVFLVTDGEDVSIAHFLRRIAHAAKRQIHLVSIPTGIIRTGAYCLGMRDVVDRVLDNLQADSSKLRKLLGWRPVINMDDQLAAIFSQRDKEV